MNLFRLIVLTAILTFGGAALAEVVNINQATADQLTSLKGIGPSKAQAIVDYRNQHGKFGSPEELANVKGIGLKTIEKNKSDIEL